MVSSDTRELTYDASKKDACVLVVNSPLAKAVIGYGAGKTFDLGGLVIQPGPTLQGGFAVITASVVAGEGFQSHGARILLTATGSAENVGMGWNATRTSVGDQWGKGPVQCEGIPFVCTLKAGGVKAWRLDARGQRAEEIPAEVNTGTARLHFGPQHQTLWYEVVIDLVDELIKAKPGKRTRNTRVLRRPKPLIQCAPIKLKHRRDLSTENRVDLSCAEY